MAVRTQRKRKRRKRQGRACRMVALLLQRVAPTLPCRLKT